MSIAGNKRKLTDYFRPTPSPLLRSEVSDPLSGSTGWETPPEYRSTPPSDPKATTHYTTSTATSNLPSSSSNPLAVTPTKKKVHPSSQSSYLSPPGSCPRIIPILTPRKDYGNVPATPQSLRLTHRYSVSPTKTSTPKNKKLFVRDSDNEFSDDSPGSGGLPEMANLFRSPQPPTSLRSTLKPVQPVRKFPSSQLRQAHSMTVREPQLPLLPPKPRQYRFSLAKLVSQQEERNLSEATLGSIKHAIEQAEIAAALGEDAPMGEDFISKLAQHGDVDDAGRVKQAIDRTEALSKVERWRFIDWGCHAQQQDSKPRPRTESHPLIATNDRAFENDMLCGHLATLSLSGNQLPVELIEWMMSQLTTEKRDDLRAAYVHTLLAHPVMLGQLLNPTGLTSLLTRLGAVEAVTHFDKSLTPQTSISAQATDEAIERMSVVFDLLAQVANDLLPESQQHLLRSLARLSLDESLELSAKLSRSLSSLFTALLHSHPSSLWPTIEPLYLSTLSANISNPELRSRLLLRLPYHTARTRTFARRLATAMLLSSSPAKLAQPDARPILPRLTKRLSHPPFRIDEHTDYPTLTHALSLLDIAAGDGTAGVALPFADRAERDAFDAQVDGFAGGLKALAGRVLDTGASHMSRTEAKQVMERVRQRVLVAGRTRRGVRRGFIGGGVGGGEGDLMRIFGEKEGKG